MSLYKIIYQHITYLQLEIKQIEGQAWSDYYWNQMVILSNSIHLSAKKDLGGQTDKQIGRWTDMWWTGVPVAGKQQIVFCFHLTFVVFPPSDKYLEKVFHPIFDYMSIILRGRIHISWWIISLMSIILRGRIGASSDCIAWLEWRQLQRSQLLRPQPVITIALVP